jgi:hypothetical protein
VRAAKEAARRFLQSPGCDPDVVPRFIRAAWELSLGELRPGDAAATCCLAVDIPGRGAFVWVLGDGIALWCAALETSRITPERRDFGNETAALGASGRAWTFSSRPPLAPGESLFLATDGVADDLSPTRVDPFARWCVSELRGLPAQRRSSWLLRLLQGWPVPHHLDDKTIAILHRPEPKESTRGPARRSVDRYE